MADEPDPLPPHITEATAAINHLHESHERATHPVQRSVEIATRQFARPSMTIALLACNALWIAANLLLRGKAFDPPPFQLLQILLGVVSVMLTCMILTTQRRADLLASQREQLTLQLAIISEQKIAKTIALIEELRRDLPNLGNRPDALADQLSRPTDTATVIAQLVEETEQKPSGDADST